MRFRKFLKPYKTRDSSFESTLVRKGVIGIPQDGRMTACSYTVKHYEEGSRYGIDGGRISKLAIKIDGKTTCCYDRGWDCEPEDDATKAALAILIMEYN